MGLDLSSPVIRNRNIPQHYTCDGDNVSPPLEWDDVPAESQSLILIVDDPDAPGGTFTHWVLFNIPPQLRRLPEHVPPGCQGLNQPIGLASAGCIPP